MLSILNNDTSNARIKFFNRSIALEYIFSKHPPLVCFTNGDVLQILEELNRLSQSKEKGWLNYYALIEEIKTKNCIDFDEPCKTHFNRVLMQNEFLFKSFASINNKSLNTMIPQIEVSTSSYFWLNNRFLYLELIFWSIFGVLCNLLYWGTEYLRAGSFNRNEIPVHIAKLLYTPVCGKYIDTTKV